MYLSCRLFFYNILSCFRCTITIRKMKLLSIYQYNFFCVFGSGDCIPRLRVQHTSVFGDDLPGDGGQQEEASQPRHLGSWGLLRQAGRHCFHINLDLMRRFSAMVFWIFVLFTDREVPFSIGTPYNGILHTWSRGQHCV